METFLLGGVAVASSIVGLFFLHFWRKTRDTFFLLFALAFWIDGAHRVFIHAILIADAASPAHYLPRLVAYGMIIAAIVQKNRKP